MFVNAFMNGLWLKVFGISIFHLKDIGACAKITGKAFPTFFEFSAGIYIGRASECFNIDYTQERDGILESSAFSVKDEPGDCIVAETLMSYDMLNMANTAVFARLENISIGKLLRIFGGNERNQGLSQSLDLMNSIFSIDKLILKFALHDTTLKSGLQIKKGILLDGNVTIFGYHCEFKFYCNLSIFDFKLYVKAAVLEPINLLLGWVTGLENYEKGPELTFAYGEGYFGGLLDVRLATILFEIGIKIVCTNGMFYLHFYAGWWIGDVYAWYVNRNGVYDYNISTEPPDQSILDVSADRISEIMTSVTQGMNNGRKRYHRYMRESRKLRFHDITNHKKEKRKHRRLGDEVAKGMEDKFETHFQYKDEIDSLKEIKTKSDAEINEIIQKSDKISKSKIEIVTFKLEMNNISPNIYGNYLIQKEKSYLDQKIKGVKITLKNKQDANPNENERKAPIQYNDYIVETRIDNVPHTLLVKNVAIGNDFDVMVEHIVDKIFGLLLPDKNNPNANRLVNLDAEYEAYKDQYLVNDGDSNLMDKTTLNNAKNLFINNNPKMKEKLDERAAQINNFKNTNVRKRKNKI